MPPPGARPPSQSAASLHAFNRDWSRRVLSRGAVVLLITDGLDRDDAGQLGREMERLRLSARRLIWLNPLLRWDGFEPKARGIRAILPHVDEFRPCHSLASLEEVAATGCSVVVESACGQGTETASGPWRLPEVG